MGNNRDTDFSRVAESRGWHPINPTTDAKVALLKIVAQTCSKETASQRVASVEKLVVKWSKNLPEDVRALFYEQVFEDLFYWMAFSRKQDTERGRKLRERFAIKVNNTTQTVALTDTLIDYSRTLELSLSESKLRSKAIGMVDQLCEALELNLELDDESVKKAVHSATRHRDQSENGIYFTYDILPGEAIDMKGRRKVALRPSPIPKRRKERKDRSKSQFFSLFSSLL